jgi:uncharacterized protein (UPF0335 family)
MDEQTEAFTATEAGAKAGAVRVNDKLRRIVDRVESLADQKSEIQAEISEAFKDAKDDGFDVKALRQLIKLRRMEKDEREALIGQLDLYIAAVGFH